MERRALSPTEQVVNARHDQLVAAGMDPEVAARRLRGDLQTRATAVVLDEGFWVWLGN